MRASNYPGRGKMVLMFVVVSAVILTVGVTCDAYAAEPTTCPGCETGQACEKWLGQWACVTKCCDDSPCESGELCYKRSPSQKLGVCVDGEDGKTTADAWFAKRSAAADRADAKAAKADKAKAEEAAKAAKADKAKAEEEKAAEAKARAEAEAAQKKAEEEKAAEAKARAEAEAAQKKAEAEAKEAKEAYLAETASRPNEVLVAGGISFSKNDDLSGNTEDPNMAWGRLVYHRLFNLEGSARPFLGGGIELGTLPDGKGEIGFLVDAGLRLGSPSWVWFLQTRATGQYMVGWLEGSSHAPGFAAAIGPGFVLGDRGVLTAEFEYQLQRPSFYGTEENILGVVISAGMMF